jgi:AhpD family alkylhydroperoxidase
LVRGRQHGDPLGVSTARFPRSLRFVRCQTACDRFFKASGARLQLIEESIMTQRLNAAALRPDLFKKLAEFGQLVNSGAIEESILHLIEIRASQMNGCGFCLDMHVKQAKIHGEGELRLHHVAIWRESTLFSQRERACLAWTEVLTRLPETGVPDDIYERVRTQLSEKEITELSFAVMTINAWNRLNVAFRTVPGSFDKAFGLDKAQLAA